MATRALNVVITGDARGINKVLDQTQNKTHKWGTGMAKGFAVAGAAAVGGLAVGLKKSADAAIESENAQSKMVTQLKAAGVSYKAHAKQIDEVIQKVSKLSGLDDEDLQDSFTSIVRVTGDVNKSLKLTGLAADFARAKHMDVAKAGEIVAKVAGGNTGILSRYGLSMDKGATSSEALAILQKKFAGQAEAYGKTTAGAMDRAGVASENLGEIVGAKFTPLLAKGANALVDLVDASGGLAGPIRTASGAVRKAYDAIGDAVRKFARDNREDIQQVIDAVKAYGRFVKNVITDVIIPMFKRILPVIKGELEGIITVLRGVIRIITGIVNGDWTQVWEGVKDIPLGMIKIIKSALSGLWKAFRDAVKELVPFVLRQAKHIGVAFAKGIAEGITGAAHTIIDTVSDIFTSKPDGPVFGLAGPRGDGLGKSIGKMIGRNVLPQGGAFGGSLMGARTAMRPFAALGSGFGLTVSSGLRPGAITSSGNPSWHGTGEAIDMWNGRGPDGAKLGFFNLLKKSFGGRLAELIYTPGGVGIKNGRPFRYTGQVAADHYDHVHVAFDSGRPGLGDGLGTGDGIGEAVRAARAAGFRGSDLVRIVAIAGRESGYRNSARNLVYPDHSIGMTQINQLAHHGRYGSDRQLMNPFVNFRAAWAISGHGHNFGPWSTNRGLSQSLLSRAAAAVKRFSGGKLGSSGGGGGGGGKSKPGQADFTPGWPEPNMVVLGGGDAGPSVLVDSGAGGGGGGTGGGSNSGGDDGAAALAAAIRDLKKSIDAQIAFGQAVQSTENFQLKKYLADVISGQVVGYGVTGRAFTPGDGTEFAY